MLQGRGCRSTTVEQLVRQYGQLPALEAGHILGMTLAGSLGPSARRRVAAGLRHGVRLRRYGVWPSILVGSLGPRSLGADWGRLSRQRWSSCVGAPGAFLRIAGGRTWCRRLRTYAWRASWTSTTSRRVASPCLADPGALRDGIRSQSVSWPSYFHGFARGGRREGGMLCAGSAVALATAACRRAA